MQAKLRYLKHTNEQLDKYLASEREIEKLSRSLKQSLKQTFSASSTSSLLDDEDDEDQGVNADDELEINRPKKQYREESSRRVVSNTANLHRISARHRYLRQQQTHSFDELTLLKSFYVTLMHFRTSLFKRICICDDESEDIGNRRLHQQQQERLDKTCIFCHMFKKYDSHFVQSSDHNIKASMPSVRSSVASVPVDTQFIR